MQLCIILFLDKLCFHPNFMHDRVKKKTSSNFFISFSYIQIKRTGFFINIQSIVYDDGKHSQCRMSKTNILPNGLQLQQLLTFIRNTC